MNMSTMRTFGFASVVFGFTLLMGSVAVMNGSINIPETATNSLIGVAVLALMLTIGILVFAKPKT